MQQALEATQVLDRCLVVLAGRSLQHTSSHGQQLYEDEACILQWLQNLTTRQRHVHFCGDALDASALQCGSTIVIARQRMVACTAITTKTNHTRRDSDVRAGLALPEADDSAAL